MTPRPWPPDDLNRDAASRSAVALLRNQRGVTYVVALFLVLIMGISMMAVGKQWKVIVQRDKEAELLFRGNRIKAAIEAYAADYEVKKATRATRYPQSLEDLARKPKRYLQQVYKDPITGGEFELLKVGAEIHGVRSPSKGRPLNQVEFKGASAYHDILFRATAAQPCPPGINPFNPLAPVGCIPTGPPTTGSPGPAPTTSTTP